MRSSIKTFKIISKSNCNIDMERGLLKLFVKSVWDTKKDTRVSK